MYATAAAHAAAAAAAAAAAGSAAAAAASAALTRLPMEGEREIGKEEGKKIGGNGLVKTYIFNWIERN